MSEQTVNLNQLADLTTPWCLHTVVTLRIAEHIATGIAGINELAAAAGCAAEPLHNVLGHLVGKGVFEQPEQGRFALNQPARQLLDPAVRIGFDLDGIGGRMARAWSTLPSYVRTGRPGYQALFGRPFWEDLDAHPELAASFDELIGPTGHGTPDPDVSLVDGWVGVRTVVDVGGGTGAMLAEILRARPGVHGTLVDLPRTVARAGPTFEAAGVADRASAVGQSFFDPLPAGGDLYLLKGVLNDWPDQDKAAILRRCAAAARPAGRVVVMGGVVPDGEPPSLTIEMVLLGGRNNTLAEFRRTAAECGLAVRAAQRQPSGRYVVECHPA